MFIKQTVNETLLALPPDSELVVLNDSSTDDTAEILASMTDARLQVITLEKSAGIAGARNILLQSTDSEFVATIDADDLPSPNRFRRQLEFIETCDIAFSRVQYIDSSGERLGSEKFPALNFHVAPIHLLLGNVFSNPTMFARRNAVTQLGGYNDAKSEDYDLWLRAASHDLRLRKTFTPLVKYRLHASQTTASESWNSNTFDSQIQESYRFLCGHALGFKPDFDPKRKHEISAPFLSLTSDSQAMFNEAFDRVLKKSTLFDRAFLALRKKLLEKQFKK